MSNTELQRLLLGLLSQLSWETGVLLAAFSKLWRLGIWSWIHKGTCLRVIWLLSDKVRFGFMLHMFRKYDFIKDQMLLLICIWIKRKKNELLPKTCMINQKISRIQGPLSGLKRGIKPQSPGHHFIFKIYSNIHKQEYFLIISEISSS